MRVVYVYGNYVIITSIEQIRVTYQPCDGPMFVIGYRQLCAQVGINNSDLNSN